MDRKRKRSDISNDVSCDIETKVNKFNIVCTIPNFSQRPEKTGIPIESPSCVIGSQDRSQWCLWVYPNGRDEDSNEYVSVFLMLEQPDKAKVKYGFSIINDKGEEENVRSVKKSNNCVKDVCWGFSKFVRRDLLLNNKLNDLLVNDKLTISCEVEIIDPNTSETSANTTISQSKLPLDCGDMFELPFFTDCVIKAGDTEFKAHKVILSARSSVFFDIFKNTLEESQTSVIESKNFRGEVVKEMLRYIYKNEVLNIQNMASDVLAIAEKYKLDGLKAMAVKSLCDDLSTENVCKRFILSEKFSSECLKEFCQTFIIDNAESLMGTGNWEELAENHPLLVESLFLKSLNIPST
uniref:BTB domain-containing protein n=1 Tax=Strongyloides papillosus TaxID=174720 RepID=A0A0N5B3X8_STREA